MKNDLSPQEIEDGCGPTYHRIYSIQIQAEPANVMQAMAQLQAAPGEFSPQVLARFEKTKGLAGRLAQGDEFKIHITGPWNGPVRATRVHENHFILETLAGHMEAGEIHFRIHLGDDAHIFEIESFARSSDRIVDLIYDKLAIAKAAQTQMWTLFCLNFAKCALALPVESLLETALVKVVTQKFDDGKQQWIDI